MQPFSTTPWQACSLYTNLCLDGNWFNSWFPFDSPIKFLFFVFCLLSATSEAYGGSQLGVKSELQLPAYTTATAMPDPSLVCDLHHCLRQRQILNPLRKARDQTCVLMDTSRVCYHWVTKGTPWTSLLKQLRPYMGLVTLSFQFRPFFCPAIQLKMSLSDC